jgi:hypothetical protein
MTASVVRRADEFLFLEGKPLFIDTMTDSEMAAEIVPWPDPSDVPARRKPGQKKTALISSDSAPTMLDSFLTNNNNESATDIIENEDGTMDIVPRTSEEMDE